MDTLEGISVGALFAVSLLAGGHLVLLARRTGELPELLMGISLLGLGPCGYGLRMAGLALEPSFPILAGTLRGGGALGVLIGAGAHYFFVAQVFRPRSRPAFWLALVASALLAVAFAGDILARGLVNTPAPGHWFWLGLGLRLLALAWGGAEALARWLVLRRRLRIGLADPLAVHRLLLFGVGMSVPFVALALSAIRRLLSPSCPPHDPGLTAAMAAAGVLAAACIWLGFSPPAPYRRWIAGRRVAGAVPSAADRA